ncbi:MAG: exodeoxyribonuclease III [Halanaerobiales bacterium]|nr:exodeoxyribonuclease III [Halanaerobiales bacterium]
MDIFSWNVNGIRAVTKKGFFDWIEDEGPDILTLQEIRIQEEQISNKLQNIDSYYSYFNYGKRKGYSGVALYSKIEPNKVENGLGIKRFDQEGRVIKAFYDDFVLMGIYFPNGKRSNERLNYKLDFYDEVLKQAEDLKKEGHSIIISGDYNTAHKEIDLINPEQNKNVSGFLPIERKWLDKLINHGYVDTFRHFNPKKEKYSWWSYRTRARERNAGWRIDYHFVSEDLLDNLKKAVIHEDVMGSDHCPISITLDL